MPIGWHSNAIKVAFYQQRPDSMTGRRRRLNAVKHIEKHKNVTQSRIKGG